MAESYTDLLARVTEVEEKLEKELLKQGRSELYWHFTEELERLYQQIDEIEAQHEEWGLWGE